MLGLSGWYIIHFDLLVEVVFCVFLTRNIVLKISVACCRFATEKKIRLVPKMF